MLLRILSFVNGGSSIDLLAPEKLDYSELPGQGVTGTAPSPLGGHPNLESPVIEVRFGHSVDAANWVTVENVKPAGKPT